MTEGIRDAWEFTRSRLGRIAVVLVLFGVLAIGMIAAAPRDAEPSAVGLEMAGDRATFGQVLAGGGPSISGDAATPARGLTCPEQFSADRDCARAAELARRALRRDLVFIATYVIWALGLCLLGAWSATRERTKSLLYACAWAAGVAGAADLAENAFLARALDSGASGSWTRAATIAATVKWSLVPVFLAGAIVGLCAYVRRTASAPAIVASALDRARRWRPPAPGAWDFGERGVCFSGGGIRSASFSLGVMQRLESGHGQHPPALARARYLAAVSGGGYIAGAAQLHASLQHAGAGAAAAPVVFAPGSPEEDHLRRHGNYLADSAGEWFTAVAQALGKLLANLALAGLAIVALSQPLGWMGRLLLGAKPSAVAPRGNWPHFPMGLGVALAVLGLTALLLAAGRRHSATASVDKAGKRRSRRSGLAASLAIALGGGAAVLATTAFALPLLNGLGRQVAGLIGRPKGVAAASWPTAILTAVLGRLVTKALKRETSGGATAADPTTSPAPKKAGLKLPFAKNLTELIAGPVVALVLLGYLTALASLAREDGPGGVLRRFGAVSIRDWHLAAGAAATVFVVVFTVDAVSWSMHRFYKRRLWSAFTYDPAAEQLDERDWSTPTKISEHGKRLPGRPELVLCGAAHVSGPGVAPPGHRAVTWTFDHEWIGGPEIGWCPTTKMETELGKHGRAGDVSMFGAVAIAGAAFGSAMGRHSMGSLNSLLALSNARLGVWLPNPAQLRESTPEHKTWSYRRHTLTYLVREIFGRYSPTGRWLLVADGGHYENLGLVELFRRRCTKIVCIDASGDSSGAVTTVAEALRIAEQELGVTVDVVGTPWDNAPGGGDLPKSPEPLREALKSRLAQRPIVQATITYPPEAGLGAKTGDLIVGRSVLDPEAPWPVLSYAVGNDSFPNDPTGDQWFNADQFDDYLILGRYLGTKLLPAMAGIGWYG